MSLSIYLLLLQSFYILNAQTQSPSSSNHVLPSTSIDEDNLEDSIIQIFNRCKCVMFYMCDEENFIIAPEDLKNTQVPQNYPLKRVQRLTCSNSFYYCCKNRTSTVSPTTTPTFTSYTSPTAVSPTTELPGTQFTNCGQGASSSSRTIDEFPWTVAIFEKKRNPSKSRNNHIFKCGGALIHPKAVLTAQHCVRSVADGKSLKVTGGSNTANQNSRVSTTVSKIIKHNQYYSGGLYNDIALLILEQPFDNINSVCLPKLDQKFSNVRCFVAKWTLNSKHKRVLSKIDLPMVDFQTCENLLVRTTLGEGFTLHSSFLCAGGEEGRDTCQGDGGSALVCAEDDHYVQAGITSWGVGCGLKDVPGLYTDVAKFRGWIDDQLKNENVK